MNLDIGSGGGKYLSIPRGDICLDISKPVRGIIPKELIIGDAHHLPFKNNCFNKTSAHNLLEHVKNPWQVMKEMQRVSNISIFTQDKIWSIGAIQEYDHLWFQLPGLRFKRFPRTRFGITFSKLLRSILIKRPINVLFREKHHKLRMKLLEPHYYYRIVIRK